MVRLMLFGLLAAILGAGAAIMVRAMLVGRAAPPPIVVSSMMGGAAKYWRGHDGPVTAIGYFNPPGNVVSAGRDGQFHRWDAATGELLTSWPTGAGFVTELAFPIDGGIFMATSTDRKARLWGYAGLLMSTLELREVNPTTMAWSTDRPYLAVGGANGLTIYDTEKQQPPRTVIADQPISSVSFHSAGKQFVAAVAGGMLRSFELYGGRETFQLLNGADVVSHACTPDGARMLTSDARGLRLWDCVGGKVIREWPGHGGAARRMFVFEHGEAFVTVSTADDAARVWKSDTGEQLAALEGVLRGPSAVVGSADGERIALGDEMGQVVVWEWRRTSMRRGAAPLSP